MVYAYPKQTIFGRVIPKAKIYENCKTTTALKKIFVQQVKQIRWANELSQDVLNIDKTQQVPKIVIVQLDLHTTDISVDVLRTIDKAIPLPIIFELVYNEQVKTMAIYKRPSDTNAKKWVTQGDYLFSEWQSADTPKTSLPNASNLERLYTRMLSGMLPAGIEKTEDITLSIEKIEQISKLEKQLKNLVSKKQKEKQFNRVQDIQQKINILQQQISELKMK